MGGRFEIWIACVGLLLWLTGCVEPSTQEPDCTLVDPFPYAFLVEVRSAASGRTIEEGLSGEAVGEGVHRAMIKLVTGELAATVSSGTYALYVRADGFQPWSVAGVTTRLGVCGGFDPVRLEARLVPAS